MLVPKHWREGMAITNMNIKATERKRFTNTLFKLESGLYNTIIANVSAYLSLNYFILNTIAGSTCMGIFILSSASMTNIDLFLNACWQLIELWKHLQAMVSVIRNM